MMSFAEGEEEDAGRAREGSSNRSSWLPRHQARLGRLSGGRFPKILPVPPYGAHLVFVSVGTL